MDWWNKPRQVQILVDNESWILPVANQLCAEINAAGDRCVLRRTPEELETGDVAFLLGCTQLVSPEVLNRNRRNLVVHESNLPEGRGFAPVSWQVLAGRTQMDVCLLEATEVADGGDVFLRQKLTLKGTELCDQIRERQGQATLSICMKYLTSDVEPQSVRQSGIATRFPRRRPVDSQLDISETISNQFDLLRICDNERYPAWFDHRGTRYVIRIEEAATATSASPKESKLKDGETYLVAGCKSWNRDSFDRHSRKLPGRWHYVDQREQLTSQLIDSLQPAHVFFLHWSWMVPETVLERTNCVCFHMTDLPYGRGGSPLQNLIERGHRETMLTALQMSNELDAGPIYLKRPLSLEGSAAEILQRASDLSFDMVREIVDCELEPKPQTGDVTVFQRRRPEQSRIGQPGTLEALYDHIRMLDGEGYPPAFIEIDGFRYELSAASVSGDQIDATVRIRDTRNSQHMPLEKSA